jgi:hypothetical protein
MNTTANAEKRKTMAQAENSAAAHTYTHLGDPEHGAIKIQDVRAIYKVFEVEATLSPERV